MEFILGIILIVIGGLITWGGFSGRMPGMINALGS